jgi:uncharacterized protein (TIGR02145 family)
MKTTPYTKSGKKRLPAVLLALMLSVSWTMAQVTIGAGKEPEAFSVLELISNQNTGLRMPHLTTAQRDEVTATTGFQNNVTGLARGLTIYNTTNNCMEFWNGEKWISTCEGETPIIIPVLDANATVTACGTSVKTEFYMVHYQTMPLLANYSGGTPASYQWVVDGELVSGATTATYAYTPPTNIDFTLDNLGNNKKYVTVACQMEVNGVLVQSADYKILVVKAVNGIGNLSPIYVNAYEDGVTGANLVKIAFAHVNLGAESDTDPCDCYGDLYQWGRKKDGHQLRTSARYPTDDDTAEDGSATSADIDTYGQIASANDRYGKFIKATSASNYSWYASSTALWGDGATATMTLSNIIYNQSKATPGDPCPTGWKVPSPKQWSAIMGGTSMTTTTYLSSFTTTANTLTTLDSDTKLGIRIADVLYLPAAGIRDSTGTVVDTTGSSSRGQYWGSSRYNSNSSHSISFSGVNYRLTGVNGNTTVTGNSVRCVQE